METLVINRNFWLSKKVFITGHTGFKGSWLILLLNQLGAKISGYALAPHTSPSLYQQLDIQKNVDSTIADIRDLETLTKTIESIKPEIVIHMAAQPIVLDAYLSPVETYSINCMGTANILEVIRQSNSIRCVVIVTTDKCYQNIDMRKKCFFHENDGLGGDDPYSSSKACCELITAAYYRSFFRNNAEIGVASARAGNVIGGGDWSKYRLIPDIIRKVIDGGKLSLRYPNAIRPWQHVLDVLHGYLVLAEKLWENPKEYSSAWNFGPDLSNAAVSVEQLVRLFNKKIKSDLSYTVLDSLDKKHEAEYLALNSNKARERLGWTPALTLDHSLNLVADWYNGFLENKDLFNITEKQINYFIGDK